MTAPEMRIPLILGMVGMLAIAACQQETAPSAPDYEAELGSAFDTYIEVWNNKNYEQIEGIFMEDFVRVAPDQSVEGRDALIEFMRQVHATYPDFRITLGERAYAKDLSFNEWTATGTLTGEDGTTTPFETDGITMMRYRDGKITHEIVKYDTAAMADELGVDEVPHAE